MGARRGGFYLRLRDGLRLRGDCFDVGGKASGRNVRIDMPGGRLFIDVERTGEYVDNLYLTGPTNIVCKGDVTDEELP